MRRSAIARWIGAAGQVVVIDGCFLRCHGRILRNMLRPDQLMAFDAHEVPEPERLATARQVADHVLEVLEEGSRPEAGSGVQSARCGC